MSRSPVVSIIGRPNVGKSSLFNRLIKRAGKALTYDLPGVTRDRHYGITTFDDLMNEPKLDIILVDTGGFYPEKIEEGTNSIDAFFNIMTDQAKTAIEESDLVLFVVDIREGLIPYDQGIANYIRSKKKKFWLVMNKFDTEKQLGSEIDFYNLGLDDTDMFAISSAHGLGVTTLRESIHRECLAISHTLEDRANSMFSPQLQKGVTPREEVVARVALIGAPNAGKSTLLNKLVGSERALVSDIPGTTVDPIEGYFDLFFGKDADKLSEIKKLEKNDGLLFKQYEDFRKNNAAIFDKIANAYNLEEEAYGDTPLLEEEEYLDDEDLAFEGEFDSSELDEWEESDEERQEVQFDELFEENDDDFSEDEVLEEAEEEVKPEGSFWRSVHLVDTAGIRRQKNIEGPIETESVYRSLRCITEADIVLHLVDATKGLGHQDRRLIDIALEKGKSVIVLLNKMDLLKKTLKDEKEKREWLENLRSHLPWLDFCDMIPISAKTGAHIGRLRDVLKKTIMIRKVPVSTGEINRVLFELVEKNPVVVKRSGGKRFKIKYASLIKTDPPTFLLFTNKSKGIPEHYQRYLKNGLRKDFVLDNTPIHLIFRTGADLVNRMKEMGK